MPYHLIKDNIPRDVVEALEILLMGAKNGEITGIAFVVTLKQSRFLTNVAGFCQRNPTHARGMVAALDDELAGLVHDRDPGETR
jgi:hypothetical protein